MLDTDPSLIAALRADLAAADYSVTHVLDLLGPVAANALAREQVIPAERVTRESTDPAAVLVRLFTLGDPVDQARVEAALPRLGAAGALRLGLVRAEGDALLALVDLRPYGDDEHTCWIASDLSELATRAPLPVNHVLGVGGASATLAAWTPRPRVRRALDLGTGCGVQALHLSTHAEEIVATDISERALNIVRFNAALNEQDWDIRQGSMLEPVAGERFSLIVSNPPFVITPRDHGLPTYEYRDGGQSGDAVVEHLVTHLGEHLEPGGIAQIIGNWEVVGDAAWGERVADWAARAGVDVLVLMREMQDPAQYAETWARDGGQQSGTGEFARMYAAWLDDFAARGVSGIAFGLITLHRPADERTPWIEIRDARGPVRPPLGPVLLAQVEARDWLARHTDQEVLDTAWTVAPDVTLVQVSRPGEPDLSYLELRQSEGLQQSDLLSGDFGTAAAAYIGVADGELTARQAIVAIAALLDRDQAVLLDDFTIRIRQWVADGILR